MTAKIYKAHIRYLESAPFRYEHLEENPFEYFRRDIADNLVKAGFFKCKRLDTGVYYYELTALGMQMLIDIRNKTVKPSTSRDQSYFSRRGYAR